MKIQKRRGLSSVQFLYLLKSGALNFALLTLSVAVGVSATVELIFSFFAYMGAVLDLAEKYMSIFAEVASKKPGQRVWLHSEHTHTLNCAQDTM